MARWIAFASLLVFLGIGCSNQSSEATRGEEVASSEAQGDTSEQEKTGSETADAAPFNGPLTAAQKKRIGPRLRRLIRRDSSERSLETVRRRGGASVYEVILRCDDAGALRKEGIPLNSVQGEIITAHLTVEQIVKAATVEAVKTIRAATQYQPMKEGEPNMPNSERDGGGGR